MLHIELHLRLPSCCNLKPPLPQSQVPCPNLRFGYRQLSKPRALAPSASCGRQPRQSAFARRAQSCSPVLDHPNVQFLQSAALPNHLTFLPIPALFSTPFRANPHPISQFPAPRGVEPRATCLCTLFSAELQYLSLPSPSPYQSRLA